MENQRNLLFIGLLTISVVLYLKWLEFSKQTVEPTPVTQQQTLPSVPVATSDTGLPVTPTSVSGLPQVDVGQVTSVTNGTLIKVETDLVIATINTVGGVIEHLELKQEPASRETPDQGFVLLHNDADELFVIEDGLQTSNGTAPTHRDTYKHTNTDYQLGSADAVTVPLTYTNDDGVEFTKTISFKRDSYVIDINYQINNRSQLPWQGYIYGQFKRTQPVSSGGGFGQLPSYTGGVYYTEEEKYTKYDFGDMQDKPLSITVAKSWVAMLQHYFVGAFLPADTNKQIYSIAGREANPVYRFGYIDTLATAVPPNAQGSASTQVFIGPKTQSRLKALNRSDVL